MSSVIPEDELGPNGPLSGVNLRPIDSASLLTTKHCLVGDFGKLVQARFKAFPNDWEDLYGGPILGSPNGYADFLAARNFLI